MRILFLLALLCGGLTAQAQNCKSVPAIVSDLNGEIDRVMKTLGPFTYLDPTGVLDNALLYKDLTAEMVKFWNKRAGSSSWKSIGPRRLDFGQAETGRLVGTGGRMFLSAVPSNKRVLNITISELDGKGKTGYTVCRVDARGQYTHIKTGYFNQTTAQKNNQREKHTFEVKRMKGCLLTVNFDGKSVGNTFQYRVKAAPKF